MKTMATKAEVLHWIDATLPDVLPESFHLVYVAKTRTLPEQEGDTAVRKEPTGERVLTVSWKVPT